LRTSESPIAFSDLPGVSIPDVAESVSEYLALRKVAEWADRNLRRPRSHLAGEDGSLPHTTTQQPEFAFQRLLVLTNLVASFEAAN
jgi:hypothetical protein